MSTEIKTWQIIDGRLEAISTKLKNEGRTEPYDLEPWIASNPLISLQVRTLAHLSL